MPMREVLASGAIQAFATAAGGVRNVMPNRFDHECQITENEDDVLRRISGVLR